MTVYPGFGGQSFMENMMPKVKLLREEIDRLGLPIDLEVDGGVAPKTAEVCAKNGANVLVAGSAIFRAEDAASVIKQLNDIANPYFEQ
jgi:ribulose-phosphate 3-epimerase